MGSDQCTINAFLKCAKREHLVNRTNIGLALLNHCFFAFLLLYISAPVLSCIESGPPCYAQSVILMKRNKRK